MEKYQVSKHSNFYLIGVNHQTAPVEVREFFTLNDEKSSHLIYDYKQQDGDGMLILSTCNRTEIYAFADCPRDLIKLFCAHTCKDTALYEEYQVIKQNHEAIAHLFRVGAGLESKILGDFEIIGQIKKAYLFTQEQKVQNAFLDRLVNSAVQCSKQVKNQTQLSTGATSVAFAAVMHIKAYLQAHPQPKVLMLGMGKIGRTTCENLVNQTGLQDITLINRTGEKAERLAERFNVRHLPIDHLAKALNDADVVIVATGSEQPTVLPAHFPTQKPRLLLDLSMPRNVEVSLYQHPYFEVIDVDHLAEKAQESVLKRQAQVAPAEALVQENVKSFYEWLDSRKVAPTLQAMRQKLNHWSGMEIENLRKKFPEMDEDQVETLTRQLTNRITGQLARRLKSEGDLQGNLRALHTIFDLS